MSQWDVRDNPKPQQACVRFEGTETGYLMVAYGIVDGKVWRNALKRSARTDDGGPSSISMAVRSPAFHRVPWPLAAAQIHRRWRSAPRSTDKCSARGRTRSLADGKTLTATNEGVGPKGPYRSVWVFERVVPDPYVLQG